MIDRASRPGPLNRAVLGLAQLMAAVALLALAALPVITASKLIWGW